VANGNRPSGNTGVTALASIIIVVTVLYFARTVFIPLSLALLLSFMLAPLVMRLRHWGLGRIPSVVIVVLLSFTFLGIIGSVMVSQLSDLAHRLPGYEQNIHEKVQSIRASGGGFIKRVSNLVQGFTDELTPLAPAPTRDRGSEERPVPVEIRRSPFSLLEVVQKVIGSLLNGTLMAGIVVVFVIFMLLEREVLRDRLIRLGGAKSVNLTTKLLDDAAQRVSRYLLAQLVINAAYGIIVGTALYFIRVPNPLLWGMLTALLRYIPYMGIWVAAAMPAAIAFAVEPGWVKVPIVFGVFIGVDLLVYNFAEPFLYRSSTGVSPLGILVAAVFWTWLWGPVGLLLATPLTVCAVVLGRHVPNLEFLQVLLTDEPVLAPETRFYQRMLAMDLEDATEIAQEFAKGKSLEELYDKVIIPALSLAEEDRHRGKLDEEKQQFLFQNTRILVEDLAERSEELVAGNGLGKPGLPTKANARPDTARQPPAEMNVVCIPARDKADEIAALMLAQLLNKRGIGARALPSGVLAEDSLDEVRKEKAKVACVSAVPPFGYMHARYLCRRVRAQFRDVKLVGAILTERDSEEIKQRQPAIVADQVAVSLKEGLAQIAALINAPAALPPQPTLRPS
jgi:predicted PurR-regulated permease PerM